MLRTTPLRDGAKRAVIFAVCTWLLVAPAVAGVTATGGHGHAAGIGGPAGTAGAPDLAVSAADGATASLAGSTTVQLQPTTTSVDEGGRQTLAVVVTNAQGGVGAISGQISVAESEYAAISDFQFSGDPGLDNVTVTDSSVEFEGALMDTAQTGSVTVAEVTVNGRLEGETDLTLSVDTLGDENGDPYQVGSTPDAAVTVENTRNEVPLSISADADSATAGESVAFTVMRTDSNARVEANVTVGETTVSTGVDGEATVTIDESMVSDAGTITATASKRSTSQERYANDSVTITYDDSGGGTDDGGGTDSESGDGAATDDGSAGGDGAIVRTEPGSIDLAPGTTTTVDVVVTDIDGGVGAGDVTATVTDPGIVEITAASVVGDPGIGGAEVPADGARATAEFALRDGADEPPVRIVELTLRGVTTGTTTLSLSVDSLGDEAGNSYAIASTPDGGVSVSEDAGSEQTTTDGASGDDDGTTTDADGTDQPSTDADGTDQSPTATDGATSTTAPATDGGDTDEPPVPANPSTALLAFGVVIVILLGLGSLAS